MEGTKKEREEGMWKDQSKQSLWRFQLFSKNVSLKTHCCMTKGIQQRLDKRDNKTLFVAFPEENQSIAEGLLLPADFVFLKMCIDFFHLRDS